MYSQHQRVRSWPLPAHIGRSPGRTGVTSHAGAADHDRLIGTGARPGNQCRLALR
jgi:hypothetical protein